MQISSQKTIYINLIHCPLYVLGPKKRVGIWFEGCSFGCDGCISKHTWVQKNKNRRYILDVVDEICEFNTKRVTISGGEPFEQPQELLSLLQELRNRGVDDILIYSGYKFNYLKENFGDILELVDVVIDGVFDNTQESQEVYRGSANQQLYILNNELKDLYQEYKSSTKRELQILDKNGQLYVLGIPKIDDSKEIIGAKI
ncbi:Ribonucleotide reductase of class III (anaerobic), activating protein [hydrothermal vent metagenome]|uniref:Ribonucleotide reductase of class III (Anaerobic), activating protein n=1 Tax=hydrothermal vent metagenome TaxID=652676 RepID=A0A1W1EHS5_9ZZZZ